MMLKPVLAATAALTMLAAPSAAQDRPRGEAELAEMLEGRVAGEPQSCIRAIGRNGLTMIDNTALVFRDGGTLWVNRTESPDAIDDQDYLKIRRLSSLRLCDTDLVTTQQRNGNFYTGNLRLAEFVPYRRADD